MKFKIAKIQAEIFAVIHIRKTVFIDEQKVSIDEELDSLDADAQHFLIEKDNKYVATSRVYYTGKVATIGRVAVLSDYRKQGIAKFLMKNTINYIKKNDIKKIEIGAQVQAQGFYEKLGFIVCGQQYLDANIPHYPMEMIL